MSNLKRFLALTLVIAMVVSGLVLNVSSASFPDIDAVETPQLAEAADILSELAIILGFEDGTFGGDKNVTREQFALFTARIESAHPELFLVGDSANATKPKFDDVKDPTYWSAITYCSSKKIIEGRSETEFDPGNVVTFQEAVTMLARALGYTDLLYPEGYLIKGMEARVALYGEHAEFPMTGVLATQPLTRTQVLMLLYNFLQSVKITITVRWDAINGQYVQDNTYSSVLATFGITVDEGYITGVDGWGANLKPQGTTSTFTGYAMDKINPDDKFNIGKDLQIATVGEYYTVDKDGNDVKHDGTTLLRTVKQVGLDKWLEANKKAPLDLLGLKVKIFQDNRKVDNKINIPARVLGYKVAIDISKAAGALKDDGTADSLSLPFPEFGAEAAANKDNVAGNVYGFGTTNVMNKLADVDQLAKFAKNKVNYTLEYVFNGYLENGLPEFYYIFRPFSVGYYYGLDDGNVKLDTTLTGEAGKLAGDIKPAAANFIGEGWAEDEALTIGEAYLYTLYGSHFDIYAKLSKTEKAVSNGNLNAGSKIAYFSIDGAAAKGIAFNGEWAIGAKDSVTDINKGAGYSIFADASGKALLARQTSDGKSPDKYSNYFVVTKKNADTSVIAENGKFYSGISVEVYNPIAKETQTVFITKVNGATANADNVDLYDVIKYNSVTASVYEVFTIAEKADEKFIEKTEYFGYNIGANKSSVASSVVALVNDATAQKSAGTLGNLAITYRARLNSNTKAVVVSRAGAKAVLSNSELTDLLNKNKSMVEEVLIVGNAKGEALYVFVITTTDYKAPIIAGTYGTIMSVDAGQKFWNGDDQYNLCVAAIYTNGKYSKVTYAVKAGAVSEGDFVKVDGEVTDSRDGETKYSTVSLTDANYSTKNMAASIASGDGQDGTIDSKNVTVYVGNVEFYQENSIIRIVDAANNLIIDSFSLDDIRYRSGEYNSVTGVFTQNGYDDDKNYKEFKAENIKDDKYIAVLYATNDGKASVIGLTLIKTDKLFTAAPVATTTVPETTVPETTVPETTVPETTVAP